MSVARMPAAEAVESHVRAFFEGHSVEVVDYDLGPGRREVVPECPLPRGHARIL